MAGLVRHFLCRGDLFDRARIEGLQAPKVELDLIARRIELAGHNEAPVNLANFLRRATGSTEGLHAGDRRPNKGK